MDRTRTIVFTEKVNEHTKHIDELQSEGIVDLMLKEEKKVHDQVAQALPDIARAIDLIVEQWNKGGRVFVVGAGTSGRIGVLDAAELGPTFSIDGSRWTGMIAGGYEAMWKPLEEHEDDENLYEELDRYHFNENDVLIGLTASGSTPYVLSAIRYANEKNGVTISISCNYHTLSSQLSDCAIETVVGPEVIRGSTRLKAGTAQKTVMNMLSTGVMIQLGKVYENQMVDMQIINKKLYKRAEQTIVELVKVTDAEASRLLMAANQNLKAAIFMGITGSTLEEAEEFIEEEKGHLKGAILRYKKLQAL